MGNMMNAVGNMMQMNAQMMGGMFNLEPGMRIQIRSRLNGKFLCSDNDNMVCNRDNGGPWETFHLHRHHHHHAHGHFGLRTAFGRFVCAEPSGYVVANRDSQDIWETFHFESAPQPGAYVIRTHHGTLLSTDFGGIVSSRGSYPDVSEIWDVILV